MVKTWRWRSFLVASLGLAVAGIALPTTSPVAPALPAVLDSADDWSVTAHEPGALFAPGLAVHSGPGAETLAAEVTSITGPVSMLAVNLPLVAPPELAASPGAVAQDS